MLSAAPPPPTPPPPPPTGARSPQPHRSCEPASAISRCRKMASARGTAPSWRQGRRCASPPPPPPPCMLLRNAASVSSCCTSSRSSTRRASRRLRGRGGQGGGGPGQRERGEPTAAALAAGSGPCSGRWRRQAPAAAALPATPRGRARGAPVGHARLQLHVGNELARRPLQVRRAAVGQAARRRCRRVAREAAAAGLLLARLLLAFALLLLASALAAAGAAGLGHDVAVEQGVAAQQRHALGGVGRRQRRLQQPHLRRQPLGQAAQHLVPHQQQQLWRGRGQGGDRVGEGA